MELRHFIAIIVLLEGILEPRLPQSREHRTSPELIRSNISVSSCHELERSWKLLLGFD